MSPGNLQVHNYTSPAVVLHGYHDIARNFDDHHHHDHLEALIFGQWMVMSSLDHDQLVVDVLVGPKLWCT
ncbi:hypothetical protein Dsin_017944 [Dipteronia sinensis]|uniref:Uncharacterized protein n=1 Tax=Dipteronia sinensis TaxID=43782 RepID=A0AAE0AGX1_9ROSI|nr:hypothetical protein Dsin_017944 [Dipteronia sinensis]